MRSTTTDPDAIELRSALERNLRLFPRYKAASNLLPWLPVFFLYFIERVSLGDAVLLSSAYYLAVFFLEVPSGYYSDRCGRRPTLLLAACMALLASATFIFASSLPVLLLAQVFLGASIAFQSGSDSALLYDTLYALDRQHEYTERETAAQKWSMLGLAFSGLLGGALGSIDLRLAYVAAWLAAAVVVVLCFKFVEPPVQGDDRANGFAMQMKDTLGYFMHPLLGWILLFYAIGFFLQHIPYEFYQPYLKLASQGAVDGWLAPNSTPLVSGVLISISMFGGALGAAVSQPLLQQLGLRTLLLVSISVQIGIIAGLSLALHPAMLLLVMLRNFSMSMAHGPMLGAIAPHVSSAQRASFLSVLSLFGRATFALLLALLSALVIGEESLNWAALSRVLMVSASFGLCALVLLSVYSRRLRHEF
ncbi:MAG: MFS transporter [Granulosicoccaceae bacterium]